MSDDYYATLLRYHNGIGLAKLHGRSAVLIAAPDLGSGQVHRVEYRPEIGERMVAMGKDEPMRVMYSDEIHAADRLLAEVAARPDDQCRYDEPWKDGRC